MKSIDNNSKHSHGIINGTGILAFYDSDCLVVYVNYAEERRELGLAYSLFTPLAVLYFPSS
jgi:hypothetical protein